MSNTAIVRLSCCRGGWSCGVEHGKRVISTCCCFRDLAVVPLLGADPRPGRVAHDKTVDGAGGVTPGSRRQCWWACCLTDWAARDALVADPGSQRKSEGCLCLILRWSRSVWPGSPESAGRLRKPALGTFIAGNAVQKPRFKHQGRDRHPAFS
jgi:hypothetical protein